MPMFHWEWDQQAEWVHEKMADDAFRQVTRQNLNPQAGQIVQHLVTDYPWMSPGAVAGLAQLGMSPSDPAVTAVARLEYATRTDWSQPGDPVVPHLPEPGPAPLPNIDEQPELPPVAPLPGTPAASDALNNPTPQPTGGTPEAAPEGSSGPTA